MTAAIRMQARLPAALLATLAFLVLAMATALVAGCNRKPPPPPEKPAAAAIRCDPGNGGLTLPPGFCALIVADHFANLREIAVNGNGDIYGTTLNRRLGIGGLIALRDTNGDGRADQIETFGKAGGAGLAIHDGYLYLGLDQAIVRYALDKHTLVPPTPPETIVSGFPDSGSHASKTFAFDDAGGLLVAVGAPSNACQAQDRSPGSPGLDPCPELARSAGVWRFDAARPGQTQEQDGHRFVSGVRHVLAIAWQTESKQLYLVQQGRDELSELWPDRFSAEQGDVLPAEEMLLATPGAEFSWPYCYYDPFQNRLVLAPEYGGDGIRVGRCSRFPDPVLAFPAHYSPNDMLFYAGKMFPAHYQGGAFIAFHGAYRQITTGRAGYQVVFVPYRHGSLSTHWEVFADGFAGSDPSVGPEDAEHRPNAVAEGPDGSLYIADSVTGRIWRVFYRGVPPVPEDAAKRNAAELPQSPESKDGSH